MATSSFQSFVAWRYLMARPRRLAPAILLFATFAFWVALSSGTAILIEPLCDERLSFGRVLPAWLPVTFGASLALAPSLLLAGAIHIAVFCRPRPPRWMLWLSGVLAVVGFGGLAVGIRIAQLTGQADLPVALALSGGGEALLAAAALFLFVARPHQASRRLLGWAGLGALAALAQIGLAAFEVVAKAEVPVWVLGVLGGLVLVLPLGLSLTRELRIARVVLTGLLVVFVLALAALAGYGVVHVAQVPGLEAGLSHAVLIAAGGLVGLAAILALVGVRAGPGRHAWWRGWATLACLLAVVLVTLALFGQLAGRGRETLGRLNLLGYQHPMWLVIPGAIAGALIPLSFILLVIRYFFTFFSTVSIGGVTIGTMALVIVLSVMSGFENDLRQKILGSNAHILVTKEDESDFTEYRELGKKVLAVPGVVAETPYLTSEVVIAANNNYANVVIKGIDPHSVGKVTELEHNLEDHGSLGRLWPLADDGGVRDQPLAEAAADAGPRGDGGVTDRAPDSVQVGDAPPIDFSGGRTEGLPDGGPVDAGPAPAAARHVVDPAPPEVAVGDAPPVDFSGGRTEGLPDGGAAGAGASPSAAKAGPDAGPETIVATEEPHAADSDGLVYLFDRDRFGNPIPIAESFDVDLDSARHLPPRIAILPGVLVGRELVKQINLYAGEEVKIISPLAQDTPVGPAPRTKPYRVAGVFFTGMYEYDLKSIYIELGSMQDFLDLGDEVTGIEVRVKDPNETEPVLTALGQTLGPGYRVQDWQEINRSLFSALKLEKIAMFLVLAIIILVASFSIVGNLIMVVVEKAREIAVLKTLGASDPEVMRIFVIQGFFIGLVGTCVGVSLGLVTCYLGKRFGLPLNPDVYYIDKLPIHVEALSVALVVGAGIFISVLATIYPAFIAARLRPVKGLRYE